MELLYPHRYFKTHELKLKELLNSHHYFKTHELKLMEFLYPIVIFKHRRKAGSVLIRDVHYSIHCN